MCTWLWMTGEELGPFEFLSVSVLNQLEENLSTIVNPETPLTGLGKFGQWPMGVLGPEPCCVLFWGHLLLLTRNFLCIISLMLSLPVYLLFDTRRCLVLCPFAFS